MATNCVEKQDNVLTQPGRIAIHIIPLCSSTLKLDRMEKSRLKVNCCLNNLRTDLLPIC